jgi:hypothetical protein
VDCTAETLDSCHRDDEDVRAPADTPLCKFKVTQLTSERPPASTTFRGRDGKCLDFKVSTPVFRSPCRKKSSKRESAINKRRQRIFV